MIGPFKPAGSETPMGADVTIRACTPAEHQRVLELWREGGGPPTPTDRSEALERLFADDPDALVVADVDGEIVGSIIAGWDGWRGSIYRLAVSPAHRRRGIATMLVEHAVAALRARGCARIGALVEIDNDHGMRFWSAAPGFHRETGQTRFTLTG
jgi:ribosomal protein S18 acetylase RimI-like enzyme